MLLYYTNNFTLKTNKQRNKHTIKMQTRKAFKPDGFYFEQLKEISSEAIHAPPVRRRRNAYLSNFVKNVNHELVCVLRRKHTQFVHCRLQISDSTASELRDVFKLTGRFQNVRLTDHLPGIPESIHMRDNEYKEVQYFEARVFQKKAYKVRNNRGETICIHPPAFFSFNVASKLVIQH